MILPRGISLTQYIGTMNSKLIIGLLCAALLATIMLKDCTGTVQLFNPVNIDSLVMSHELEMDSMVMVQIGIERELSVAKEVIRIDSAAIARANVTLKQSNVKVRQLLIANAELKAANDTLGMIHNCNELVEENYILLARVDSLVNLIPQYQQSIDDLVSMYDEALTAANDKAIQQTAYADAFRAALEECNRRGIEISEVSKKKLRKAQRGAFFQGVGAGAILTLIGNLLIK